MIYVLDKMNLEAIFVSHLTLFYKCTMWATQRGIMKTFDTQLAMSIVSHSSGGFSYDTLARALITNDKNDNPEVLLESCRIFCLSLEKKGVLRKCKECSHSQDEYFEYIPH